MNRKLVSPALLPQSTRAAAGRRSLTLVPLAGALIGLVVLSTPAQAGLLGGTGGMIGGAAQGSFGPRGLDLAGGGRAQGDALLRSPSARPPEMTRSEATRERGLGLGDAATQAAAETSGRAEANGAARAESARGGAGMAAGEARGALADRAGALTDTARTEARQPSRASVAGTGEASVSPRRADASGAGSAEVSRGDRSAQAEGAGAASARRP